MNEKGFSLDLFGTEVSGASITRSNLTPLLLVAAIALMVAAIVFLPLPVSINAVTGPAVGSADIARWEAMGEFFQAESIEAEAFKGSLIDGWNRHADYYEASPPAAARPLIDGWNQHADYYESGTSAESPVIDGWNKHADYYAAAATTADRLEQAAIDSRAALVEYNQSHGR